MDGVVARLRGVDSWRDETNGARPLVLPRALQLVASKNRVRQVCAPEVGVEDTRA